MRELEDSYGLKHSEESFQYVGQVPYSDQNISVWGNLYYLKLDSDGKELKPQTSALSEIKFMNKEEIIKKIG